MVPPASLQGRACQNLDVAVHWRQLLWVQGHGPSCLRASGGSGRRWQTPTARPLQHPEMGGRKTSAIAEEEERGENVGALCPFPAVQEA